MKTKAFVLLSTSTFCLGLGVASAMAGPCTTEIERVTKAMSARDAGSGPTVGAAGAEQSPPTSGQAAGQHPATEAVSQASQPTATSPQDVRRQMQGEATSSQDAQGPAGGKMDTAMASLQRARDLDGQKKEAECMAAAQEAGRLLEQK
jgi:hypothetical protein